MFFFTLHLHLEGLGFQHVGSEAIPLFSQGGCNRGTAEVSMTGSDIVHKHVPVRLFSVVGIPDKCR